MTFLTFSRHLMVFMLNLENFELLLAFFKFESKWKLFAKKYYIACYELITSWIQSLFQTIQLGNDQTTKEMLKNKTGCLGTLCTNRKRTFA